MMTFVLLGAAVLAWWGALALVSALDLAPASAFIIGNVALALVLIVFGICLYRNNDENS